MVRPMIAGSLPNRCYQNARLITATAIRPALAGDLVIGSSEAAAHQQPVRGHDPQSVQCRTD
jgi:hypothetical protein